MPDFRLPDLGEGVTEAEVERWLVSEGDVVAEDDPLVEVMTDKATAEIPSPFAGKVEKIHHREGERVPVGAVLVTIADSKQVTESSAVEQKASPSTPSPTAVSTPVSPPETASRPDGRVKAMPPVRRLARQLGIDIASVTGSGPGGRILRSDVEAFARSRQPSPLPGERREPLRGIRRVVAEHMSAAHRSIPPVTHIDECDVTELQELRRVLQERSPERRLTYLPFIVLATARALKQFPPLNASLDEERQEIVYHQRIDLGIATDTPQGLVVPVLRDPGSKDVFQIARELADLSQRARAGRLSPAELKDPTFTITSPGKFAGLVATPIVFHPQTGILGVHRAKERPVVRGGQIVIRMVMNLGITFDHRVLDGVTAASFIQEVITALEHPALLFIAGA